MNEEESVAGTPIAVQSLGYVTLAEGTIASDYALKNLNKSLGEAQVEFLPAEKNVKNEFVGYKYTPLVEIVAAVRPSLTKHHLTVSQFPVVDLDRKTVTVYTRLVHWDSGEWMQNEIELPGELALGKGGTPVFNQQTIGGSQTYGQKYGYKAIVGIADSEEMIDSTGEKGDLPSRQTPQGATLHQTARATSTQQSSQQANQRAAAPQEQARPQAGQCTFIPPNGLTTVIKGVKEIAAQEATEDQKARKGYLMVTFLGTHNGLNFASCFDTKYWDVLKESVGLECYFVIKEADKNNQHFINIIDVLFVDGQAYFDGKPVVEGEAQ
jgi:hypothetical protein